MSQRADPRRTNDIVLSDLTVSPKLYPRLQQCVQAYSQQYLSLPAQSTASTAVATEQFIQPAQGKAVGKTTDNIVRKPRPEIIALEGVDGCGKSTMCQALGEKYSNIKFVAIADFYTLAPVKDYICSKAAPMSNALMYVASLIDRKHVVDAITEAQVQYVVMDRSLWSTVVASYVYHNQDTQSVLDVFSAVSDYLPIPEQILVLDVPYEVCRSRISSRPDAVKRYDGMSRSEYQQHMEFYHWMQSMPLGTKFVPYSNLGDFENSVDVLYQIITGQRKERKESCQIHVS